jgi:hypothetical protein
MFTSKRNRFKIRDALIRNMTNSGWTTEVQLVQLLAGADIFLVPPPLLDQFCVRGLLKLETDPHLHLLKMQESTKGLAL